MLAAHHVPAMTSHVNNVCGGTLNLTQPKHQFFLTGSRLRIMLSVTLLGRTAWRWPWRESTVKRDSAAVCTGDRRERLAGVEAVCSDNGFSDTSAVASRPQLHCRRPNDRCFMALSQPVGVYVPPCPWVRARMWLHRHPPESCNLWPVVDWPVRLMEL